MTRERNRLVFDRALEAATRASAAPFLAALATRSSVPETELRLELTLAVTSDMEDLLIGNAVQAGTQTATLLDPTLVSPVCPVIANTLSRCLRWVHSIRNSPHPRNAN